MSLNILLYLRSTLRTPSHNLSRYFSSISAVGDSQSKDHEENAPLNLSSDDSERTPVILSRQLKYLPKSIQPRAAWVENLDTLEEKKLGIVDLHPEVWGSMPRVDLISHCIRWQKMYKFVDYRWTPTRAEMPGGGRKPWPQKGMGRARHGSVRSPLFKNGGIVHGPRGPTSYFYMLPYHTRVLGLTSTLSVKLAQDDLHVVDSLEIPTEDPKFLEDLVTQRGWGISVLFVDVPDLMPRNITLASDEIKHINLMPAYGLNVHSMLKHETLVLTTAAVEHLEEKLLFALHRTDSFKLNSKFKINQQ